VPPTPELPLDRNGRRFRRGLWPALALSILAHLALFLVWRVPAVGSAGGAVSAPVPGVRSSGAGDRVLAVRVRPATPIPDPPPPVRVAAAVEPVPMPEPREVALEVGELPGRGAPRPGTSDGDEAGSGRNGSSDGGAGRPEFRPPVPRSVLPEWDPPDEVRGSEVTVRVHVDSAGIPTGRVELHPRTSSRSFNRRLVEKVSRMRFSPARRGREPVAGWAVLTFIF